MPGYKKSVKENKAHQRRTKREKRNTDMGEDTDDFEQLNGQLLDLGLVLKQIPGDGNCLFRALGDQLDGNPNDHLKHRSDVVQFMLRNRDDFEPFVEDDISFDQHIRNLSAPGTFGGNDSIVAFARLHNLTVVIHQLKKPLWQIHGGVNGSPGLLEAHISYHNGDHYNSVRRRGEMGSTGAPGIRLSNISKHNHLTSQQRRQDNSDYESGNESDYENSPSSRNLQKLIDEVLDQLDWEPDESEVIRALENNAYNAQAAVSRLNYYKRKQNPGQQGPGQQSIWAEGGTGTRILGSQSGSSLRQAQPRNKNLSAKRQKEMKKREQRLEKDRRKDDGVVTESDAVLASIKTLTI